MNTMKLTVSNPPGYTVEAMTRKLIWALYCKTPVEFIAMLEQETQELVQERGENLT